MSQPLVFYTISGSKYRIDVDNMTWERISHAPESNLLRTESGPLISRSDILIGMPVILYGPPLNPKAHVREITTTEVIHIGEKLTDG